MSTFENALKGVVNSQTSKSSIASTDLFAVFGNDGTPNGKLTPANLAKILGEIGGTSLGSSSTEATIVAKTATISGFILFKNETVAIRFVNAINVDNPTLNISSTGAKPIYFRGEHLLKGVVRPNTVVLMQYDGTNYNVISMENLANDSSQQDLYVDLGLPSGLLWATRNVDISQENGFAPNIYSWGSHFSWGNTKGYNPVNNSDGVTSSTYQGVYDWGSASDGEPYVSSEGAKVTANLAPSHDMARANLGSPWRLPTTNEFAELFNNAYTDNEWTSVSGVNGRLVTSKINGNTLFFPAAGVGSGTSLSLRGSDGSYWSSSFVSATGARHLYFVSSSVYPQTSSFRARGYSVRAVQ